MGISALNEERFEEAAGLLEQSLSDAEGGITSDTLVTQCRLASAPCSAVVQKHRPG